MVGLAGWFIVTQTKISAELALLLPPGQSPEEQVLVDQLRQGAASRVILLGIRGNNLDMLASLSKKLAARLRASGHFAHVYNGDRHWVKSQQEWIFQYRYLLSPAMTASHFTVTALHESLEARVNELVSPLAPLVKQSLAADPTGDFVTVIAQWMPTTTPATHRGVWVSSDRRWGLLMIETRAAGFDLDTQEDIQGWIQMEFNALIDSLSVAPKPELVMTGPAVFAVQSREEMKTEAQWLSLASGILVVLIIFAAYRSWTIVGLCVLPLGSGLVAGIACVNIVFGYVHGVTLAFGATLIGVAVDYPIHLFSHLTRNNPEAVPLPTIWPTLRLGVATTVIGYSALLFSGFPGLTQLGLFAITGISTSAVVTRWVVPAVIPAQYGSRAGGTKVVAAIDWLPKMKVLLPFFFILASGGLVISSKPVWESDLANLSPVAPDHRMLDQKLRRELGGPDVRHMVVVVAQTEEEALKRSEALVPVLNRMVTEGLIGGYDLAARYLPSQATQRKRQALLPEADELRAHIREATKGLPFNPDVFEPFVRDIRKAKTQDLLTLANFPQTGLRLKMESLLFSRHNQWVAVVPLQNVTDWHGVQEALAEQSRDGVSSLDIKEASNHVVTTYLQEMLRLLAGGGIAVVAALFLGLRSGLAVVRVFFPVVVAAGVVVGTLHFLDHRLSLFHLASLLLVGGLGLDYGLFFHRAAGSWEERVRTVHALVVCCSTTVGAFGLLALSRFPVLQAIGATAALGSLLCLLFSGMTVAKFDRATVLRTPSC